MVYSGIMTGIIICVLAYSCWMDIRQREIPIELYVLVILPMGIIALIMGIGPGVFEAISMAVIVGICYTILALYFQGGGGDLIMMVSLALCLGYQIIFVMTVSTIVLFLFRFMELFKKKSVQIPYAPFVLLGFTVERIAYYFNI